MSAIAIIHYHLRAGGVTRVIQSACQCLEKQGVPYIVLSASPKEALPKINSHQIPELEYGTDESHTPAHELLNSMRDTVHEALGKIPVIWHFHNHSLGKNCLMGKLVSLLAESGESLILQTHDFAEDGRPENYHQMCDNSHLYPIAPQIHYAFINARDQRLLQSAGLPKNRSSILTNPVNPPKVEETLLTSDSPLVFYPVRALRRKNLGELCLLAALAPEKTRFAVGLAPDNKEWQGIYDDWCLFAEKHHLPILFGVTDTIAPTPGAEKSYASWLAHSTHILTTSIAEGFGMAFIEPLMLDKPLLGRDLPDITCDFKSRGIRAGHLYTRLLIPLEWIGFEEYHQRLAHSMRDTMEAYHTDMSSEALDEAINTLVEGEHIDFANLPEDLQQFAIEKILNENLGHQVLVEIEGSARSADNWLTRHLTCDHQGNEPTSLQDYTIEAYNGRLKHMYASLSDIDPEEPDYLDPYKVLKVFLNPQRFHFLRSVSN